MDESSVLALAIQLLTVGMVVSALVLYLMYKIRSSHSATSENDQTFDNIGGGRGVLITSADTLIGAQLALHLATRGFRVFAGTKPPGSESDEITNSVARKILEAKWKHFQATCPQEDLHLGHGNVNVLPLDVTREDLLHEALGSIRRHLPAGEDGLWAVINTAGLPGRGRLEGQNTAYWDTMLKLNVTGTLRVAKTFMPLLRCKKGRLVNIGAQKQSAEECSLVAHTASRYAVEGASVALRHELRHFGIKVITLQPEGVSITSLFSSPSIREEDKLSERYAECNINVLPTQALKTVETALLSETPETSYTLSELSDGHPINSDGGRQVERGRRASPFTSQ